MGPAAARFYGDPTALLRVVGITGTNGKTTTAFLLRDVLEAAGLPTGLPATRRSPITGSCTPRTSSPARTRTRGACSPPARPTR